MAQFESIKDMVFDKATNKIIWRNMEGEEGQVALSVIKELFCRLQSQLQQEALPIEVLHVHYVLTRIQDAFTLIVDIISRMLPITKYAIKEKLMPGLLPEWQIEVSNSFAEIPDNNVEVTSASIEEIVVKGHVGAAIDMAANNPGVVGSTGIVLVVI